MSPRFKPTPYADRWRPESQWSPLNTELGAIFGGPVSTMIARHIKASFERAAREGLLTDAERAAVAAAMRGTHDDLLVRAPDSEGALSEMDAYDEPGPGPSRGEPRPTTEAQDQEIGRRAYRAWKQGGMRLAALVASDTEGAE